MTAVIVGIVALLFVALFVALFLWNRRMERDVDYDDLESPKTEEQRRAQQLGIALSQSSQTFPS